jgi:betaine-aldehyde dehydrogenase
VFIAGAWRDAADGATFDVLAPASEDHVATVAAAGEADIDTLATREALDIGRPAFEPWMVDLPHVVDVIRNVAGWADKRAAG